DVLAVGIKVSPTRFAELVTLAGGFQLHGHVAEFLQVRQRGVDHARAWAIEAVGARFQFLDQFIAVPRLLRDQREQQELQIVGAELPAAHQIVEPPEAAESSVPAPAEAAAVAGVAMSGGVPERAQFHVLAEGRVAVIRTEHGVILGSAGRSLDISKDIYRKNECQTIRYRGFA